MYGRGRNLQDPLLGKTVVVVDHRVWRSLLVLTLIDFVGFTVGYLGLFGFDLDKLRSDDILGYTLSNDPCASLFDVWVLCAVRMLSHCAVLLRPNAWSTWADIVVVVVLVCKMIVFDYGGASTPRTVLLVVGFLVAFVGMMLVQQVKQEVRVDDEENPLPKKKKMSVSQLMLVLKPYFWPDGVLNRLRILLTWLMLIGSKTSNVLAPLQMALAVNKLTKGEELPVREITLYCALTFGNVLFKQLQNIVYLGVKQTAFVQISQMTFKHLHSLSLEWHLKKKMGNVLRAMDRGVSSADTVVTYLFLYLGPSLVECVVTFGIFFVHFRQPSLSAIAFVGLVAYAVATVQVTIWRNEFRRLTNKHDNDYHDKATESLINYETVKYFANEDFETERYCDSVSKYQKFSISTQASLGLLNALQELIVRSSLCAVLLLSGWQVIADYKSGKEDPFQVGDFVAVNVYMMQLYAPLSFLGTIYGAIIQAFIDMQNLSELLVEEPDVCDIPNAPPLLLDRAAGVEKGMEHASGMGATLEFRNVFFKYPSQAENQGLKDVSFTVPPGSTLAVVGHTGSGKTTIARLLFRFYDTNKGQVLINGQDISQVQQRSLRKLIGVVPQDTVLFNDTILFNVKYGKTHAQLEEVQKACQDAQILDFIEKKLPKGWESSVGERGLKLSGGEKQRVAIARALLKNPPIVLLDEATSALDSLTEQTVQAALNRLGENRTTIIIAHRLSTIRHADQIMVLNDGRIMEKGTHADLIAKKGEYYSMWNVQEREQQEVHLAGAAVDEKSQAAE